MGILRVFLRGDPLLQMEFDSVAQLDATEDRVHAFASLTKAEPLELARDLVFDIVGAAGLDACQIKRRELQRDGLIYFVLANHEPRRSLNLLKEKIAADGATVDFDVLVHASRRAIQIVQLEPVKPKPLPTSRQVVGDVARPNSRRAQ